MTDKIYWPLSSRGFFSELLVYLYIKNAHRNLYGVDVLPAFFHKDYAFWNSFLNLSSNQPLLLPIPGYTLSPITPTRKERLISKITRRLYLQQFFLRCNASLLFSNYWNLDFERDLMLKYPDFYDQLRDDLINFFPSPTMKNLYNRTKKNFRLEEPYNAIHIRRGDKIALGEASEITESVYLDFMRKHDFFNLINGSLVIISDDSDFAQSLACTVSNHFSVECIINPFSTYQVGNNSVTFTALPINERIDAFAKFLFEFLLLANSETLGVSLSSYVGKALSLLRCGHSTYSFDNNFSIT